MNSRSLLSVPTLNRFCRIKGMGGSPQKFTAVVRQTAASIARGVSARVPVFVLALFATAHSYAASGTETKPLRLLGDKDFPPMAYLEGGTAKGLDVDLARALAGPLGREVQVELVDWNVAQERVLSGEADGLFGLSISEERRKQYDFAAPMSTREFGLFVRRGNTTIHDIGNLAGRKVAVTPGGYPRTYLEEHARATLVFVSNYNEGLDRLADGSVDALAADLWVGAWYVESRGVKDITIAGRPFTTSQATIAVRKGNLALIQEVNQAIEQLRRDGTLARLQEKWRPQEVLFLSRERIFTYFGIGVGAFLALFSGIMSLWVITLKRQIRFRRRVEKALRDREGHFRQLAKQSPVPIAISNERGDLEYLNDRFMATFGYTLADIPTRDAWWVWAYPDPEYRKQVQALWQAAVERADRDHADIKPLECRVTCKDGTVLVTEFSGARIGDHRLVLLNDVTERRRAEDLLRRQLAFDEIITGLLAGLASSTGSELDAQVDNCLCEMAGFIGVDYAFMVQVSADFSTWSYTHEWCGPGVPGRLRKNQNVPMGTSAWAEKVLLGGDVLCVRKLEELPPEAAAVRQRWEVEGYKSLLQVPLRGHGGLVQGSFGLASLAREAAWVPADVQGLRMVSDAIANALERSRAEEALRKNEAMLSSVLNSVPQSIYWKDRDGVYLGCNEVFARQVGDGHPEWVVGRTDFDLPWPPGEAEAQRSDDREVIETEKPKKHTVEPRSQPDGTMVWLDTSKMTLLDPNGRIYGVLGVSEDVTDRRRAEERERWRTRILEALTAGGPLATVLDLIVRSVEAEDCGAICSILLLDGQRRHLLTGAAPSMPEFFNRAIYGAEIHDGAGTCGTAAFTGKRVITENIPTDPRWGPWRELAQKAKVVSCWSEPVFSSNNRVLGTFAIYHRKPGVPTDDQIQLIKYAANLASLAIERKQAEERLQKSGGQLRALSARLQSLREEERTHLAREIHDHLGQLLTALKLDLRAIERKLVGLGDSELRAALLGKLNSARELTDETITSVQKIASELRPAILDRLGLEAAIESEAQAFQSRTGLQCEWNLPERPTPATLDSATAVFRIFQEILTNVARHAHATHVGVRLGRENGSLLLEVEDDGVGIKESDLENPSSLGLLGMRERAEILGGGVTFARNAGKGTTVKVRVPLEGKAS